MTNKAAEHLNILLVEDNPAHAELIIRNLEHQRIPNTIYHISDGEAALDYLFRRGAYADPQQSPRPHVILLDLRLPKIDGLTILKEIKSAQNLKIIPTVILTTSSAEQDIAGAYEQHANSYLVKPTDFEQFSQLLKDVSTYWLKWNNTVEMV